MARIAIIGAGAIGGVAAAILQGRGVHEIFLCVRRPLPELTVETPDGEVRMRATILAEPNDAPAVDWVLLATKAYDVPAAAKWLPPLRGQGAPVAVLQNGVEHRERLAPYVPMDAILPVMVECPTERPSPDRVRQRGVMRVKVPEGELGRSFVGLFEGTAADASVVPDFLSVVWRKLCFNAAGALSALALQPAGIMREEAMGRAALQMVRECADVARAEGARLDADVEEAVMRSLRAAAPDVINSMLADRMASRPMEIDARNGAVVRIGLKHGIPTPNNTMAVALLEVLSRKG